MNLNEVVKYGEVSEIVLLQMQHLSLSKRRNHKKAKNCFIDLDISENIGSPNILKSFFSGNILARKDLNNEVVQYFLRRLGFLSSRALPEVFFKNSGIVNKWGESG